MNWNINYTKTLMIPGENLGLDCTAFEGGQQVDLRLYEVTLILRTGATVVFASNGGGGEVPLYRSSRNSIVLNLTSANTKKFFPGRLNVEINLRKKETGETVNVFSQDTVLIVNSKMTGLV